jgi:hypothetical protein
VTVPGTRMPYSYCPTPTRILLLFLLLFPGFMKQETYCVGCSSAFQKRYWSGFAINVTFQKTEPTPRSQSRVTSP